MARYNTLIPVISINATTTLSTPTQGTSIVEFTGTSYTVTLYSPASFPGAIQTFYNAASGAVTLSVGQLFIVPNVSSSATYIMPVGSTVTLVSDGTNFIVKASQNGAMTGSTLTATSTVSLSPANANVTISPSGTGTVTMAPATAGELSNVSIGQTTALAGSFTSLSATGTLSIFQTIEAIYQQSGYGTSQSLAYTNGAVYYLTGMTGNFTFNWTSVPTTTNKTTTLTLMLGQGGTAYVPTTLQINGTGITINWAGGVVPTGRASKVDVVTFFIYNLSGTFVALGQLSSYG